jgi:hypothetical protein
LIPSETERNPGAFDRLVRAEIARGHPSLRRPRSRSIRLVRQLVRRLRDPERDGA